MKRWLTPAFLALCLTTGFVSSPALAQEAAAPAPEGEGGESSGDPLYGYIGTGIFAALAVFAICKSARR